MSTLNNVRRIITEAEIDQLDNQYVGKVVDLYRDLGVNSRIFDELKEGVIREKMMGI